MDFCNLEYVYWKWHYLLINIRFRYYICIYVVYSLPFCLLCLLSFQYCSLHYSLLSCVSLTCLSKPFIRQANYSQPILATSKIIFLFIAVFPFFQFEQLKGISVRIIDHYRYVMIRVILPVIVRDVLIADVLQMMGRAGRPQYDDSAVAVIYVQDVKKNFYKRFLYEPFPVESRYHDITHIWVMTVFYCQLAGRKGNTFVVI